MSSSLNITASGSVADSTYGSTPQPAADTAAAAASSSSDQDSTPDPADLRLVIEDDQAAGSYVYKTIDPRTGQVVQQFPREQILKLREALDYSAGSVIKAKV
jgi:flagellar protein FlaG